MFGVESSRSSVNSVFFRAIDCLCRCRLSNQTGHDYGAKEKKYNTHTHKKNGYERTKSPRGSKASSLLGLGLGNNIRLQSAYTTIVFSLSLVSPRAMPPSRAFSSFSSFSVCVKCLAVRGVE